MQVFPPIETILPNSDDNPSFLPAQSNCLAPLWAGRQFSQAISLGSFCHSAQILREVEYRAFSGPFDWIFSSPKITAHILQDDFNLFLDPEYYEPVPLDYGSHRKRFLAITDSIGISLESGFYLTTIHRILRKTMLISNVPFSVSEPLWHILRARCC